MSEAKKEYVFALYPYESQVKGALTFKKGDRFEVKDQSDPDWWRVVVSLRIALYVWCDTQFLSQDLVTGQEGLVPWNHMTRVESYSAERFEAISIFSILLDTLAFSWFFENASRTDTDRFLMAKANPRGKFLVRPSEQFQNGFSLR